MLRTLAINSNKKCVKFWCFHSFLITKAIWDWGEFFGIHARSIPGQSVRIHHRRASGQHIRVGIVPGYRQVAPRCHQVAPGCRQVAPGCRHFIPGCRHLHPDARHHVAPDCHHLHPAVAHFPPRMFTSGIQDSDGRAAILHSAAVFSWSFLIFAIDILGYFEIFCFRYLLSKFPKSPCNPPIIRFLSY